MDKTNWPDMDLIYLRAVFEEGLLLGKLNVMDDNFTLAINTIGSKLYDTPNEMMTPENIETLKYVILICNVLYNRTDMDQLPIDDGFYDLLLEKYKNFDSNFQVGAAVVEFKESASTREDYKEVKTPIRFINPEELNQSEINTFMRNKIMREGLPILTPDDIRTSPVRFDPGMISKRTHNTIHEHPSLVGTLDKCKFVFMEDAIKVGAEKDNNVKILERDFFAKHISEGIIRPNQEIEMILELKYDGVSVEADCTNVVESARTRGDTGVGVAADITPILKDYPFHRAGCRIGEPPIGVKFEAIMTKSNLRRFSQEKQYNYVNCRTAIIGLTGSSDAFKYRDYITLIPLAVDRNDLPSIPNRLVEIEFMNQVYTSHGEPLRYCYIKGTVVECLFYIKKFMEEASCARSYLDFAYDGIVVSYLDEDIRERLGRENSINKYSMAVKFNPMSKLTMFRGYTFEVGQNGNITPMIHYDPVEFMGTIHRKCSGASLNRFTELGLHYGDLIEVTYVNDVMPYVNKPDCEHNRKNQNPLIQPPTTCPVCGTTLTVSSSGKSMMCPNKNCEGRVFARVTNMLAKMNLKGFAESSVRSIGVYTFRELIDLDREYLLPRIGEVNSLTFVNLMIKLKTEPIYDYVLIGALGFTGIAQKTWKAILSAYTLQELLTMYQQLPLEEFRNYLVHINGIGPITAETIADEWEFFLEDLLYINSMPNVMVSKGSVQGKQIRFSGCRNKQLEEQLRNAGYDADSNSSVTKNTDILIVPYEGFSSSKTKKMGAGLIVPINDFMENMDRYLH